METEMERPRSGAATIWILPLPNEQKREAGHLGVAMEGAREGEEASNPPEHLIIDPRLEGFCEPIK